MELLFGGVPGRPSGDGFDGHAWWPLFSATPIEYIENYYPMLVERYRPIADSGGPGLHRGGAGIEKVYRLLEPGKVSIHDDREVVPPWGSMAACHGGTSEQVAASRRRHDATRIPSKVDNLKVSRRPDHLQDRRRRRLGRSAGARRGAGRARRPLRAGVGAQAQRAMAWSDRRPAARHRRDPARRAPSARNAGALALRLRLHAAGARGGGVASDWALRGSVQPREVIGATDRGRGCAASSPRPSPAAAAPYRA